MALLKHGIECCQAGERVLSLEWLRDRSAEEARAYLMSIDGGRISLTCCLPYDRSNVAARHIIVG